MQSAEQFDRSFDVAIIGAGTAGCVLASRLSEKASRNVVLIEAGPDFAPGKEPSSITDSFPRSYSEPRFLWNELRVEMKEGTHAGATGAPSLFEQGRLIGGGSNIMGMYALRGLPADYDEWETLGAAGWSWQDVLPYFIKLERDADFAGVQHGQLGLVNIQRFPANEWPPFARVVCSELQQRGFNRIEDFNTQFDDGYGPLPMSRTGNTRVSAASAYLTREVRARPNLQIMADTSVEQLIMVGSRVIGVEARRNTSLFRIGAREVLVAAGALHSPGLLLRAGIGDPRQLRFFDINVSVDRPGVGKNLQNHPRVYVAAHLRCGARQPNAMRALSHAMLRYSSHVSGCPAADMLLVILNKTFWHRLGSVIAGLGPSVYKPFSRGEVTLKSPDCADEPLVRFRLLSDRRDLLRLVDGLKFALDLFRASSLASHCSHVFVPTPNPWVRKLSWLSRTNRAKAAIVATALDAAGPLRPVLLKRGGLAATDLPADVTELERRVFELAGHMFHPAGTCRMGRENDPAAVVDSQCRVHGAAGLRVVDASVMPTLPRGNTNIPVLMIAEKIASTF